MLMLMALLAPVLAESYNDACLLAAVVQKGLRCAWFSIIAVIHVMSHCSILIECCLACQVIRMRETLQRFHKNKLVPFNEKLSGQQHYSFTV